MHAKHTRLELCSRDYDNNIHNPESLEERDRGNGSETRPGAKPSERGDVASNLPALGGKETLTLQDGEEVSEEDIAEAIRFMLEKHHILVEGAAALSVAAYMKKTAFFERRKTVLLITGCRVSLKTLKKILEA